MKIYQLHRYGGEWEDHYDDIIGTYLYLIRAEEEMQKVKNNDEVIFQHSLKCLSCPLHNRWKLEEPADAIEECEQYCEMFKIIKHDFGLFDCGNWISYYDKHKYRIEEVEVIE